MNNFPKKLTIIFLTSLTLTSCLIKKKETDQMKYEDVGLSIVSRGFFTVGEALYFSNGKDIYCGFKDWDMVEEYKVYYPSNMPPIEVPKEPDLMKYVPICTHDLLKIKDEDAKKFMMRMPEQKPPK